MQEMGGKPGRLWHSSFGMPRCKLIFSIRPHSRSRKGGGDVFGPGLFFWERLLRFCTSSEQSVRPIQGVQFRIGPVCLEPLHLTAREKESCHFSKLSVSKKETRLLGPCPTLSVSSFAGSAKALRGFARCPRCRGVRSRPYHFVWTELSLRCLPAAANELHLLLINRDC